MAELFEIRVLVAADDAEHGDLLLGAVSDTLDALVGEDRYGAVLFEGVNPNGTEVPEGFAVIEEEEAAQIPALYVVPELPDDDEITGAAI